MGTQNYYYGGLDKDERLFIITDGLWGRETEASLEVNHIIKKEKLTAKIRGHPILPLHNLPILRQRFYSPVTQAWEYPIANACFFAYLRCVLLNRYTLQQLIEVQIL